MPDLFGYDHYDRLSRSAGISDCGRYRYWLRRSWATGGDGRTVCFVMLNPSTADALADDPTVRRCMAFARAWGFSTLSVRNLFAYRATDPADLRRAADPVGPHGDAELAAARTADLVVAAWGRGGGLLGRDRRAVEILAGVPLFCLKVSWDGRPRHPLYVSGKAVPVPWPAVSPGAG